MRKVHQLKTWPSYFREVRSGRKQCEVRKDDRAFEVGHILELCEWDNETGNYTGRSCGAVVTHILRGGHFGVEQGYVVMSINLLDAPCE